MTNKTIDTMKTISIFEKNATWIVREDGKIFSSDRESIVIRNKFNKIDTHKRIVKGKEISPFISKSGYFVVSQKIDGKRPKVFAHRLIGMAFVPGYKKELTINHINGIKTDNRLDNLEWISRSDNTKHQWEIGLVDLRGEKSSSNKLSQKQVLHIREALKKGVSANSLAIIANLSPSLIYLIGNGKRWASLIEETISY